MANLQVTFDQEQIQEALFGDRGPVAVLMESVLNQVLQSEMTDLTMDEFYRWKADQREPQTKREPLPIAA